MRSRFFLASAALGCVALTALGVVPSAHAGSWGVALLGPSYVADYGEQNHISIFAPSSGAALRASENVAATPITGGPTCSAVPGTTKQFDCPAANRALVVAQLLDKDDTFDGNAVNGLGIYVDGGTGIDAITTGSADDFLGGAAGNDTANGGPGDDTYADEVAFSIGFGAIHSDGTGNDTFNGGSGADLLNAGADHMVDGNGIGADTFNGGTDIDTADYSARTAGLSVSVDSGVGNDGAAGEGDTIAGVERVLGGAAADQLGAASAASTLVGNGGSDTLAGGPLADRLVGGDVLGDGPDGDDTLDGGGGPDIFIGGRGRDTATYAGRATPVTVTLGEGADDGAASEKDDVRDDIERVIGGSAGDALTGNGAANSLLGGDGPDVITPGGGADSADGGPGDDRIEAGDVAQDTIACGDGNDLVVADADDIVAADCETVDRSAPAGPGAGGTAGGGGATGSGSTNGSGGRPPVPIVPVQIMSKALKLSGGKKVRVKVTCPGTYDCAGEAKLTLDKGARLLGSTRYGLPAGKSATLTITLRAKARARLKPSKKQAATLAVSRSGAASAQLKGNL